MVSPRSAADGRPLAVLNKIHAQMEARKLPQKTNERMNHKDTKNGTD
jgi:hypothetical protein